LQSDQEFSYNLQFEFDEKSRETAKKNREDEQKQIEKEQREAEEFSYDLQFEFDEKSREMARKEREADEKEKEKAKKEAFKREVNNYEDFLLNPMLSGIDRVASAWNTQFEKNLNASFRNGKTVMDQFFIGLLSGINQAIQRALIMQAIFSFFSAIGAPGVGTILGGQNIIGSLSKPSTTTPSSNSTGFGIQAMANSRRNAGSNIHILGEFVQRGTDLVAVAELTNQGRNVRAMRMNRS